MKPKTSSDEHAAGWDVMENGIKLFTLEFVETDQPFYKFKAIDMHCPEEKLVKVLSSAGREPIDGLVYKNRLSQSVVPDEMFCGGYHDGIAGLRDFRPRPWWVGTSDLLLLGLMLVLIILLLVLEYKMNWMLKA